MPMVKSGQLRLSQTLDDSENGGVYETERQTTITVEQLADPAIVLQVEVNDSQPTRIDIREEAEKRVWMET